MPIYDTSDETLISGTDGADVIYGYPEPAQEPSEVIASGLYRPLFATAPAGDANRLFVVSQGGVIKIHDLNDPQAEPQVFLDLGGVVNNNTEAGLLGFTFHPDFATNGKCYVNYTTPDNAEGTGRKQAVVEYTFDPNNLSTPPTSKTIMMIDYPQEHSHHRAGWLGFGPDGMLYIATGEDTVASNAQTVTNQDGSINHLGKILRIDVSGDDFEGDPDRNYSIPDDPLTGNPTTFDNINGELDQPSEIWAVGLRNPWRASFGPDGKLYVADVGQNTYEEINIVEAGKNYGWREAPVADGPQNTPGYTDPYYYYGRDVGGSVTGGYFYEGPGPLNGKYIFGDFNNGHIFAMDVSGEDPAVEDITNLFRDANGNPMQFGHLSSFGLDGRGNLYAISYADDSWGNDTGQIFRLSDSTPPTDGPDSIEAGGGGDVVYASAGNDTVHGGDDDDHLYGEADDDRLYGDAGADTLEGGTGNDIYYVDGGDAIVEKAGEGTKDRIRALDSFVLQAGQEIEEIFAADPNSETALDLTGNAFGQMIIGNAGDNVLNGNGGEDTLGGGAGNDTYIVDGDDDLMGEAIDGGTADRVISSASYTLDDFIEHLTLSGTAAINGTGNGLDNEIIGNTAANILNGDAGLDTLRGGGGNDTYILQDGDIVDEASSAGIDTVESWLETYELSDNVENLILNGPALNGIGNALANAITGNDGNNILDGAAGGIDTLTGGGGNDEYFVGTGDRVVEAENGGTDTIRARDSFALQAGSEVEALWAADIASTAALNLTGNAFAQMIVGNAGANVLNGGGGVDTLGGLGGNDTYYVDDANDIVRELQGQGMDTVVASASYKLASVANNGHVEKVIASGSRSINLAGNELSNTLSGNSGANRLYGGSGHDTVSASSGNDSLNGSDGNDKLSGGTGRDTLTGGSGRDTFIFNDRETGSSKTKADYISDFSGRSRDKIDLELVDANTKKSGDQDFSFIGTKAFSKEGQMRYEKTKGYTYVYLNTDADKSAEAVIKLKGALSLSKSWFDL